MGKQGSPAKEAPKLRSYMLLQRQLCLGRVKFMWRLIKLKLKFIKFKLFTMAETVVNEKTVVIAKIDGSVYFQSAPAYW